MSKPWEEEESWRPGPGQCVLCATSPAPEKIELEGEGFVVAVMADGYYITGFPVPGTLELCESCNALIAARAEEGLTERIVGLIERALGLEKRADPEQRKVVRRITQRLAQGVIARQKES